MPEKTGDSGVSTEDSCSYPPGSFILLEKSSIQPIIWVGFEVNSEDFQFSPEKSCNQCNWRP